MVATRKRKVVNKNFLWAPKGEIDKNGTVFECLAGLNFNATICFLSQI